jgi:Flp pilus assembly protein TadD
MILVSENATRKFEQSETAPQFTVEAPRLNPLVASSTFSLTKGVAGVALDSIEDVQEQPVHDNETLSSRIITRSKRDVERRPNSARAHAILGIAFLNAGQLTEAKSEFEAALGIDPHHYVAAANLARIETQTGNFEEAERIYTEIQRNDPKNSAPVVSLAFIAMKRQDWVSAERLLRDAIQMGHRALTARYHLAMVQLRLGKPREAISLLRSVARDEVRAPLIYEGLGAAYALNGDFHRAAVAFKTALSLAPASHNAVRGLTQVLLHLKLTDEAIGLLVDHLERMPRDHEARELLARAYVGRKKYRSAIAQLVHVFTEAEAHQNEAAVLKARVANNIGVCFLRDGSRAQARRWFVKALDTGPEGGPLPYQNLARVYILNREYTEALELLEQCRKSFPDDQTTVRLIAGCLTRCGLYDQAVREVRPFIESGKATEELYADMGRILADGKGDYQSALEILQQGYAKFSKKPAIANNLAYVYLMLGDATTARSILESIVPSKDDDDDDENQSWRPVVLTATWGLVHITEGDLETGSRSYGEAERLALGLKNKELARTVNQKMHLELARAYLRKSDYQNARKHVRQGLSVHYGADNYERDLHVLDKRLDLGSN